MTFNKIACKTVSSLALFSLPLFFENIALRVMSLPSFDNPLILTVVLYFDIHLNILSNLAHHSSFDQEKDTSFNVRTDLLSHTICEGISVMPHCSSGVASGALAFETSAWDGKFNFKSSTGLFDFQGTVLRCPPPSLSPRN